MNYIKQLNLFDDLSVAIGLPTSAQTIYYKLLSLNNRAAWAETFIATNQVIMFRAGIRDEKTFIRNRNLLKQANLIDFVPGKKGQPTRYKIIDLEFTGYNPVYMPVQKPVNMPVKTPVQTPDIYKQEENKKEKSKKNFTPPTLEDVKVYCLEKELTVNPADFYNYFESGNWIDSKGNKVRNWKQKILTWQNYSSRQNKQATVYKPPNGKGVFVAD